MLRNLLIFSLCFVAIRASGEFSILSSPKSISFKGNDALQSQYIGDVLYASVGNAVAGDAQWDGMTVNDPFNLAKGVIAVLVEGSSHISVDTNAKTFNLEGSSADESLNAMSSELEASSVAVCDINFNDFEEGVSNYRSCFGDVSVAPVKQTKNLSPTLHSADKQFLQIEAYINTAAENLAAMQKASNFLIIRLSLEPIAKAHGKKSEAMQEASKLVAAAISKLNAAAQKSSNNDALVVAICNENIGGRSKREIITGTPGKNEYNLAEYYNQDYPVIFNIILWFMVAFGFALLAICYAIGSMDPGRDSIIYRMTSTRMKKDN